LKSLVEYEPPLEEEGRAEGKRKLMMVAFLAAAVLLAIVLIVRLNSPAIPTEVLDTKSGSVSPPPSVEELKSEARRGVPPLDLSAGKAVPGNASAAKALQVNPVPENPPTVVEVPTPKPKRLSRRARRLAAQAAARAAKQARTQTAQKAAVSTSASPAKGEIQVLTDPPGANVVVDGSQSCVSPCSVALGSGRHTLTAGLDGYGTSRRIFHLPGDASIFIPMTRSLGVLVISSHPAGANVQVDGKSAGNTPLTLRLPPGLHRVSVWDGARWREQNVEVEGDGVDSRTFVF
jgi:hypothetical protein